MSSIKDIRFFADSHFIFAQKNNSPKIFTPPTKEECENTIKKIGEQKQKLEEAKLKAAIIHFTPLPNGVKLFDPNDIKPKLIPLILKHPNFKEDFQNNRIVLDFYNYDGKQYLAVIPKHIWEKLDYKKNMDAYYASRQYWKDISSTASKINVVNTAFNCVFDKIDHYAKKALDKVPNACIRRTLYFFYGVFKGKVLTTILTRNPYVLAVSGGLFIADFGLRIIFDFGSIIDLFKNGTWEQISEMLGTFAGAGLSSKGIKNTFRGKKVSIKRTGEIETTPTIDTELAQIQQKATQQKPPEVPYEGSKAIAVPKKTTNPSKSIQNMCMIFRSATLEEKLNIAKTSLDLGYPRLAASFYREIARLVSEIPKSGYVIFTECYKGMKKALKMDPGNSAIQKDLEYLKELLNKCGKEDIIRIQEKLEQKHK